MSSRLLLLTFGAAALLRGAAVAQSPAETTVVAGRRYDVRAPLDWLVTPVLGPHHRDLWKAPVAAQALDFDSDRFRVTGVDSVALVPAVELADATGAEWEFVPLDIEIIGRFGATAPHPAFAFLMQDLLSARHPGAPLVAARLAAEAGLPSLEPALRVGTGGASLGTLRPAFDGQLGYLYRAPSPRAPAITSADLIDSLAARPEFPVDSMGYLATRMFELWTGSTDLSPEDARWVRGTDGRWRNMPRLHAGAFARFGGLVPLLVRPVSPLASSYKEEFAKRLSQNPAQFALDARLATPLPQATWDSVAHALAARVTDEEIASATAVLPAGWDGDKEELARAIIARRDGLVDAGRKLREKVLEKPPEAYKLSDRPLIVDLVQPTPPPPTGTTSGLWFGFEITSDYGILVGAGPAWTTRAPGYSPYKRKLAVRADYATSPDAFRIKALGDFRKFEGPEYLRTELMLSGMEVARFYGFGNETEQVEDDDDFYSSNQLHYVASAVVGRRIGRRSLLEGGVIGKYVSTKISGESEFITTVQPYGTDGFAQAGVQGRLVWDSRDTPAAAQKGALVQMVGAWYPPWLDAEAPFGHLELRSSTYLTPMDWLVLAPRIGVKRAWGKYPLHEAAFLGGYDTMRGLALNRYAGDVAAWISGDARARLGRSNFLGDWDLGVVGLLDAGRVWVDGEESGLWHTAKGGGIWILMPDRSMAGLLEITESEGRWSVTVDIKMDY